MLYICTKQLPITASVDSITTSRSHGEYGDQAEVGIQIKSELMINKLTH